MNRKSLLIRARILEAQIAANLLTIQTLKVHHPSIHSNLSSLHRTGRALAAEHLYISLLLSR